MSRRLRIPVSAVCIDQYEGMIPCGEFVGKLFVARLFDGLASHGYRSGYERKPARWYELRVLDGERQVYRQAFAYSGKRYAKALADFKSGRESFEEAQAQPAVA